MNRNSARIMYKSVDLAKRLSGTDSKQAFIWKNTKQQTGWYGARCVCTIDHSFQANLYQASILLCTFSRLGNKLVANFVLERWDIDGLLIVYLFRVRQRKTSFTA